MAVPYTFGTATASIPLSQLDSNFATAITLGNTAIQLGNTVTTLNNMTLANVTISSGNITLTNVSATTANVTTANVVTMIVTGNETVLGNTTVTGTATAAKFIPTGTSVTGNGMYLPATNSVGISTAGTNAVYIDASQNVGIGTSSPSNKLQVTDASVATIRLKLTANANGTIWNDNASTTDFTCVDARAMTFGTSNAEQMRINSSGNVGIGTISPAYTLDVQKALGSISVTSTTGTNYAKLQVNNTGGSFQLGIDNSAGANFGSGVAYSRVIWNDSSTAPTIFYTNGTERMRIDSSGNLLVGLNSSSDKFTVANGANSIWTIASNLTASTGILYGTITRFQNQSPNNVDSIFSAFYDSTTLRFSVTSNGGIRNYSANNVNLSDARTKTDIQDAGNYLTKICAIPVRTFKYKDQTDDLLNLGVIAQEVEAVAPELIDASGFGETPEDGIPLKAIYQTDLQYALMKCIQEQQALITTLTARIEALEAK
jgi:hypothetical protein